jgi:hypothetical protein
MGVIYGIGFILHAIESKGNIIRVQKPSKSSATVYPVAGEDTTTAQGMKGGVRGVLTAQRQRLPLWLCVIAVLIVLLQRRGSLSFSTLSSAPTCC